MNLQEIVKIVSNVTSKHVTACNYFKGKYKAKKRSEHISGGAAVLLPEARPRHRRGGRRRQ